VVGPTGGIIVAEVVFSRLGRRFCGGSRRHARARRIEGIAVVDVVVTGDDTTTLTRQIEVLSMLRKS